MVASPKGGKGDTTIGMRGRSCNIQERNGRYSPLTRVVSGFVPSAMSFKYGLSLRSM